MWLRRQTTKFNGVSYIVQRAAEAVYWPEGAKEVRALSDEYLQNPVIIREALTSLGYRIWIGANAPYVWVECKQDSWESFDRLPQKTAIAGTPGVGFGRCSSGFVRLGSP